MLKLLNLFPSLLIRNQDARHTKVISQFTLLITIRNSFIELSLLKIQRPHYGEIRAGIEKTRKVIANKDLWIAARAIGVTLITNNTNEFSPIIDLNLDN